MAIFLKGTPQHRSHVCFSSSFICKKNLPPKTNKKLHPRKQTCPLRRGAISKRKGLSSNRYFLRGHVSLVGGFNPFAKIWVKMGSSSPNRDEHKKYLSCHHLGVSWWKYIPSFSPKSSSKCTSGASVFFSSTLSPEAPTKHRRGRSKNWWKKLQLTYNIQLLPSDLFWVF